MQIKTIMRYHFIPVRMALINKMRNNCCIEKGTLVHCWWECKLMQPLRETVWRFLRNLRIELPYGPPISLLGNYLKNLKTFIYKDIYMYIYIYIDS